MKCRECKEVIEGKKYYTDKENWKESVYCEACADKVAEEVFEDLSVDVKWDLLF